jgi:hypothetical protein
MRNLRHAVVLFAFASLLASCAPAANPLAGMATASGAPAGFWLGLWHGLIVWVTFVISLFDPGVGVYELHNAGWPYDLGFVLGAGCLHGFGAGRCRRRERG